MRILKRPQRDQRPQRPQRRSWLAALPLLAASCAAPGLEQARGPEEFLRRHYESLRPGADWGQVRRDFVADAEITRNDSDQPGELIVETVDNFFAKMGPSIDAAKEFEIVPLGISVQVYDRIASGWAYVEVTSVDEDGSEHVFRAVDLLTLFLDSEEQWRITHLLYQTESEGWPPEIGTRRAAFTRGGMTATVSGGYRH